ncbi:hypothetical protein ACWOAH_05470 [Vagococcus vulneris]|nr:hypothetical protein [Vagococcus vulneris]
MKGSEVRIWGDYSGLVSYVNKDQKSKLPGFRIDRYELLHK